MAFIDNSTFGTTYADSSGTFADNTVRAIVEATMRQFAEDIKDSVVWRGSSSAITFTVVEIGTWNMRAGGGGGGSLTKTVAHGLSNYKNIRSITGIIRDDADSGYYSFGAYDGSNTQLSVDTTAIDATNIVLRSRSGGTFDDASFDNVAASYNRGWITIGYVS